MRKYLKLAGMIVFCLVLNDLQPLQACTGIRMIAADGSVVSGRTMEFGDVFGFLLVAIPAGQTFPAMQDEDDYAGYDGLKWRSKYSVVGVCTHFALKGLVEGLNEKGLSAGCFYHQPMARYQIPRAEERSKTTNSVNLVTYLLTCFETVEDIVSAAKQQSFLVENGYLVFEESPGKKSDSLLLQVHYFVNDRSGKSLVIEFIDGKMILDTSGTGVITNCPEYNWHKTNLNNYVNLFPLNAETNTIAGNGFPLKKLGNGSGMLGLPGDFTPPSRFVRAFFLSKSMQQAKDAAAAVENVFHILNSFDIAKGYIIAAEGPEEQTLWTSASDLSNLRFYYHTYNNRQIRMFDLKNHLDKLGKEVIVLDSSFSTAGQSIQEIGLPGR